MTKGYTIRVKGMDKISVKLDALMDISTTIEQECADLIQERMRMTAVDRLTGQDAVDTGALRDSIETKGSGFTERQGADKVSIGIRTDVHYALPIEYGSGSRGEADAPGKKSFADSWVYPTGDPSEPFRTAKAQPARPFMRPALYDNGLAFKQIIADHIQGEIDGH